ncbi:MAG TPA: hypothetical protein VK460_04865 [Burkholderiales bacterium]|nr:hypothetical protein [Burkholderiales bacterium]
MTDDQFKQFLGVQMAQLAMLQGICNNVQVLASGTGRVAAHHWGELEALVKNGMSILENI